MLAQLLTNWNNNDTGSNQNEGEWIINDNISFDYHVSVGLFEAIKDSSLHMPLHKPSASGTPMNL